MKNASAFFAFLIKVLGYTLREISCRHYVFLRRALNVCELNIPWNIQTLNRPYRISVRYYLLWSEHFTVLLNAYMSMYLTRHNVLLGLLCIYKSPFPPVFNTSFRSVNGIACYITGVVFNVLWRLCPAVCTQWQLAPEHLVLPADQSGGKT